MNLYNVYFVSKGTGPRTVQIEAQNSAGVKAQVEARYPGAYNITLNQLPTAAKKKRGYGREYRECPRVFSSDFSEFRGQPRDKATAEGANAAFFKQPTKGDLDLAVAEILRRPT